MSNLNNFNGGSAKFLKEQWLVDIQLKAGDSEEAATISAHKLVLAARSEVFKKMFESDEFKTCNVLETVTFSEMKQEELEAFVEFIYSCSGSLSTDKLKKHVRPLYIAANKYEIPQLKDLCRKELISSMNASNAPDVLEIAKIDLFDQVLNDAAVDFISENLKKSCSLSEVNDGVTEAVSVPVPAPVRERESSVADVARRVSSRPHKPNRKYLD